MESAVLRTPTPEWFLTAVLTGAGYPDWFTVDDIVEQLAVVTLGFQEVDVP
jgi:hypothetical protein